jgi:hypothetical protein
MCDDLFSVLVVKNGCAVFIATRTFSAITSFWLLFFSSSFSFSCCQEHALKAVELAPGDATLQHILVSWL